MEMAISSSVNDISISYYRNITHKFKPMLVNLITSTIRTNLSQRTSDLVFF